MSTIFTERNKKDFAEMIDGMMQKAAGHSDLEEAIEKVRQACIEHQDDFSAVESGELSSAVGEVWYTYYSEGCGGGESMFKNIFLATIEIAKGY